jgi:diguanylate cyclase (GGDEF)-like protein
MSVMGRVVGVIHAFRPTADATLEENAVPLEAIANQVGTRLGIVRAAATMQVQASTDPLTGLLNRRSFESAATPLLRSGRPTAVAMADLDHFKRLNDTYGHEAGDRALRTFARTLRTTLRGNDVVGRLGGEEFAVVLPDCSTDDAVRALEGVRNALITAIARAGVPPFTVSIGVVDASAADGLDALTSLADKALYEAKRAGRDRIVIAGCGAVEAAESDRAPRGSQAS